LQRKKPSKTDQSGNDFGTSVFCFIGFLTIQRWSNVKRDASLLYLKPNTKTQKIEEMEKLQIYFNTQNTLFSENAYLQVVVNKLPIHTDVKITEIYTKQKEEYALIIV
jgi:asparagine N-glycosylation enzyme membrane subunit Stt3